MQSTSFSNSLLFNNNISLVEVKQANVSLVVLGEEKSIEFVCLFILYSNHLQVKYADIEKEKIKKLLFENIILKKLCKY